MLAVSVVRELALIPSIIHQTSDDAINDIVCYYEADMPYPDSFRQEFRLWNELWRDQTNKPSTLTSTVTDPRVCRTIFQTESTFIDQRNIKFHTERANSSLKYIKTFCPAYNGKRTFKCPVAFVCS